MTEQAGLILAYNESFSDGAFSDVEDYPEALATIAEKNTFIEDLVAFTDCLMALIPAFEGIARKRLERNQTRPQEVPTIFDVTEPARTYVRQIFD